jgi:hypothetical protein
MSEDRTPPPPDSERRMGPILVTGFAVAVVALVLALGVALVVKSAPPPAGPVTEVAPTPSIIVALRDLSRLESLEVSVEKVIDLKTKEPRLFGLVETQDALLLIAVGEATLGVDLGEVRDEDVIVDWPRRSAQIRLPAARVLSTRLDNQKTYVHKRDTDLLARRNETLETEARRLAEQAIRDAGERPDVLAKAGRGASRTVEALVRSLGFTTVEVRIREP